LSQEIVSVFEGVRTGKINYEIRHEIKTGDITAKCRYIKINVKLSVSTRKLTERAMNREI
jgi:hypothetical protein